MEEFDKWIPVIEAVLWPAVLVAAAIWLRDPITRVINAIAARVERGDHFEAGAQGIKLGVVDKVPLASTMTMELEPEMVEKAKKTEFYLVHSFKRDRSLDRGGTAFFRLSIWLDADEDWMLQQVASVTYMLHPTFRDPVRQITDRSSQFKVNTSAWGEFNLHAEVKFNDGRAPLQLERYLNLSN